MITITDRFILMALLFNVPMLSESALVGLCPASVSALKNMKRRLRRLCEEHLLDRHVAHAQVAANVALFYHWVPGMPAPKFGALGWALTKRWDNLEPTKVTFYTATDSAGKHYGRSIHNPLKATSALSHNIGLGQCYLHFAVHYPPLAQAWVAEDVIASVRGYGEKVVDACIVDSTSTPALAIEFAGASYLDSATFVIVFEATAVEVASSACEE